MNIESLTTLRSDIQNLLDKNPDDLNSLFNRDGMAIESESELQKAYDDLMAPGRQLHIGIVGRVKAGKSSLLNSLFFKGKEILPKAATPMTAALTKLKYSEKPTLTVNFFNNDDIEKIRKNAGEYDKKFKQAVDEKLQTKRENAARKKEPFNEAEARKKCESLAKSDLTDNVILAGAREQIDLINNASASVRNQIGKKIEKEVADITALEGELKAYVGSDGAYTPITKDVELGLPFDELQNITVVDTPGFDDPVPSRDAAARESLKSCDVIFILSPAGQFCNQEDKVNIEKIEKGEGIQEIFVVASKIDAELGNEEKDKANGSLETELNLIVEAISSTLDKLISGMQSGPVKEKLGKDLQSGLLYTSGMCQAMVESWDENHRWNGDMSDTWERLQGVYPDLFGSKDESAKAFLEIIGNIEIIKKKIAVVRSKKDEILGKRRDEWIQSKYNLLVQLVEEMSEDFIVKATVFKNTDFNQLKKEQEQLNEKYAELKAAFQEMLSEEFEAYHMECRNISSNIINDFYSGTKAAAQNAESERSETRRIGETVRVADPGWWGAVKRTTGLCGGGYHDETHYRDEVSTYTSVNATEVRGALTDFADGLKETLYVDMGNQKKLFRTKLKSRILNIWDQFDINEFCSVSMRTLQASKIVSAVPDCELDIEWSLPASLQGRSRLRDEDAEEFMDDAYAEFRHIKSVYTQSIKEFLADMQTKLNASKAADMVLEKMQDDLTKLSENMENKAATLDRFQRIEEELKSFKSKLRR